MIVVIDYNVGNIQSVGNALRHLGYREKFSRDPEDIQNAAGIILPGVAAFGYAVKELGETAGIIKKVAEQGKPLLGICVGFQMLFESSTEMGDHKGLGLIEGKVVKIPPGNPIPHMGWNKVQIPENMELFTGLKTEEYFYFAHSYHATEIENGALVANTDYGVDIAASVQKKNFFGVQFHPEKSGTVGMKVLRNFERICRKAE